MALGLLTTVGDVLSLQTMLTLMCKYGVQPTPEMMERLHEKFYETYNIPKPETIEAHVAINTQRDIDAKIVAPKEPEKPKRTWRNLIKLFHDDEPKRKLDGYAHNYRR